MKGLVCPCRSFVGASWPGILEAIGGVYFNQFLLSKSRFVVGGPFVVVRVGLGLWLLVVKELIRIWLFSVALLRFNYACHVGVWLGIFNLKSGVVIHNLKI